MAIAFNGTNSVLYCPTGQWGVLPAAGWTISFWFRVSGDPGVSHQHWFYHRSGAALTDGRAASFRINESSNSITALVRDDVNTAAVNCIYSNPGEWGQSGWVHAVVQKSRPQSESVSVGTIDDVHYSRLYLNNHVGDTDTRTGSIDTNFNPIVFGKIGNAATDRTLSGDMAEFCIFNRVLTKDEVNQLYNGHDPQFLNPVLYFPFRNDYIDRVNGLTGIGISNVPIITDHPPVVCKGYYPGENNINIIPDLLTRVGRMEQKGLLDFIDWIPGAIAPSGGYAQTGAFFGQARVGECYQAVPNRSISGCIVHAYASNSGTLTMTVHNPTPVSGNLSHVIRWSIYRL